MGSTFTTSQDPARLLTPDVRRLLSSDARDLTRLLAPRAADNAYLLGYLERNGAAGLDETRGGVMLGAFVADNLVGAALIGTNLVLGHGIPHEALGEIAEWVSTLSWNLSARGQALVQPKVIVGPDALVSAFVERLGVPQQARLLERGGQLLLQVDNTTLARAARSPELRPAQMGELDLMMACDLAMVREELGVDPFTSDLEGYQEGWRRRILEWRAWVAGPVGGPIHCKVDQSVVSPHVVQLAGVYTAPAYRDRGLAQRVVGEMCHLLLREVSRVVLHVNAANTPALRLYRSLGFYEVGRVRSVWLK